MKRLLIVICLFLAACQPPNTWQEVVNLPTPLPRGGTLTYALDENLDVFQPWNIHNRAAEVAVALTQSGLTRLDGRGQPQPELAKSWQADETGMILTVTLHDDLRWSDGVSLTSDDVVYTYQSLIALELDSSIGRELELIRDVISKSPTVLEFRLREPYSPIISLWALPILPRHVLADQPLGSVNLRALTVGAGPFVQSEITASGDWQLRANEHYHRGQPLFDAVLIRLNQTPASLGQLVTSGAPYIIDTMHELTQNNLIINKYPLNSILTVAFNMRDSRELRILPLRHELIRIAESAGSFDGLGAQQKLVRQLTLPGHWLEVPELNSHAIALDDQLAQQGWTYNADTKKLERAGEPLQIMLLVQSEQSTHGALAAKLVAAWEQAGIQVTQKAVQRSEYLEHLIPPYEFDVAVVEWAHGRSNGAFADTLFYDPDASWLFASDALSRGMPDTRGSLNIVGMDDEGYDMLAKSSRATYDAVGRLNAERNASIRIHDVAPYYFGSRSQRYVIRSANVASASVLPTFDTPWYFASIESWYTLP